MIYDLVSNDCTIGVILRWKIDFAEMEIAAEMDNQDFDDGFI